MVLFMFVIMLLNADVPSLDFGRSDTMFKLIAGLLCVCLFALFVRVFKGADFSAFHGPHTPQAIEAAGGNTRVISEMMFSEYLLPFEITSVLLLAGIVGAVAIAKREKQKKKEARS